ncbi:unnamed protein product [Sphagnum jensenii]|uniref:BRO1 domain-containing protein n=1 Tax=Sphagnum jensenii TaxID=128206 RepID=A0ABP0WCX0_9BRYO
MLLQFKDPLKLKTKRVVYEETYYARDSGTLEQLKELSTKRQAIEESINGSSKITPAIAREMAGGVTSPVLQDLQKLERYLPLLENLVTCVEAKKDNPQIIKWTIDLSIRWTSPMSGFTGNRLTGPRYFRLDDLRFELAMVFFLYGGLLRELALEVLPTDMVESATLFRRAAGVFQHLAETVLPPLQPVLPPDRCPEATVSMASIMSIVCLAEAQAVTVRRAEEKATSGGLLAKLHYGVVQFLEEAATLLRAHIGDWNDVSDKLRRYMSICSVLHESRSQRFIAAEYTKIERFGVAVGVLRYSLSRVQQVRPTSDDTWKIAFRQEQDALQNMLRKCDNENDFIWREKIPRKDELPVLEGLKIVASIPYQPFGLDREFIFVT